MKVTLMALTDLQQRSIAFFGPRILTACLKREGHDVQSIFLPNALWKEYDKRALSDIIELSKKSDLVGVSLMSDFFDNAISITKEIKKNSSVPVLWGGIHPTVAPEECLNYADAVCMGEGEETLVEFAEKIKNGEDFYKTKGFWLKNKGKTIKNRLRPLIQNLDSIPFPDYDYEDQFILSDGHVCKMNEALHRRYMWDYDNDGVAHMTMFTRGCPFGCTYCCNNVFNKMYAGQEIMRKRSVDNIITELAEVKRKSPFIKYILLCDDCFFKCEEKEIKEFSAKYKESIGLPFHVGGATPVTISREKLSYLVDAGMKSLQFGIQTGSERTKRMYKRVFPNRQIEKSTRLINEFKDRLMPTYDILLDNPWETGEDLTKTVMFLTRLPKPFILALFSLTFFPGAELSKRAEKEGIIEGGNYRKDFYAYANNYFNGLFVLLREYARRGRTIPPAVMFLLTNKIMRLLRLNWPLYVVLKIRIAGISGITEDYYFRRANRLLREGLRSIRKGGLRRIIKYLTRKLSLGR